MQVIITPLVRLELVDAAVALAAEVAVEGFCGEEGGLGLLFPWRLVSLVGRRCGYVEGRLLLIKVCQVLGLEARRRGK